jgi:hypothetical protein
MSIWPTRIRVALGKQIRLCLEAYDASRGMSWDDMLGAARAMSRQSASSGDPEQVRLLKETARHPASPSPSPLIVEG